MEDTLGGEVIQLMMIFKYCLNPCSNGILSDLHSLLRAKSLQYRLNPCSNRMSLTKNVIQEWTWTRES